MSAEGGENPMRQLERYLLLQFTDQFWKDHLLAMDRLRDGIGLRGYGQRNPLLEYKKEAFNMYMYMTSLRDEAVIARLVRMRMQVAEEALDSSPKAAGQRLVRPDAIAEAPTVPIPAMEPIQLDMPQLSRPTKGIATRLFAQEHGVRRNDPCPCGSGLKFKKCCAVEGEGAAASG
jgi:preprotein translocase subunit SecA